MEGIAAIFLIILAGGLFGALCDFLDEREEKKRYKEYWYYRL